jgi:hypothetical protein
MKNPPLTGLGRKHGQLAKNSGLSGGTESGLPPLPGVETSGRRFEGSAVGSVENPKPWLSLTNL